MEMSQGGETTVPETKEDRRRRGQILCLALRGRCPSAASLATSFETSPRTIHRDITKLRHDVGLELSEPDRYGFRRPKTPPGAVLHAGPDSTPGLTPAQLRALVMAEAAMRRYEGTPFGEAAKEAFERLLQELPESSYYWALCLADRVRFSGRPSPRIGSKVWDALMESIANQSVLEMLYLSRSSGRKERRKLNPSFLIESDGDWLAWGWCHKHRETRTFNLAGIVEAEVVGPRFVDPPGYDPDVYTGEGTAGLQTDRAPALRYRLRFLDRKASLEATERPWHLPEEITWDENGDQVTVAFETTAEFVVERWVLAFGGRVEVLEPEGLRRKLRKHADEMLRTYAEDEPED